MKVLKEVWQWAWLIAVCLLLLALVVGPILAHVLAPCSWVDWMPVKNLPGRCLPGGRG